MSSDRNTPMSTIEPGAETPFIDAEAGEDRLTPSVFIGRPDVETALAAGFTMSGVRYMLDLPVPEQDPGTE